MTGMHKVSNAAQVEAALHHPDLVPPSSPESLGTGVTAKLRDGMARFSSRDGHLQRRTEVETAMAVVDLAELRRRTIAMTNEHVSMREHCDVLADIGFVVPTEALAATIGVPSAELAEVRRDVRSIVLSIGRGEPASAVTDEAAGRLLARFDGHPGGAVAAVSMLYQNHDATAALLAATLLADARGDDRRNALARTVRVATDDVRVGNVEFVAREVVEISLENFGQEFGAGPHRCPGIELAETIVDAISATLREHTWEIDLDRATFAPDGRATALPRRLTRSDEH